MNKNIIKNNMELLSNASFITQNRFVVSLNGQDLTFNPYEIEYFNEKDKKRVVLNIRYTVTNISNIEKLFCSKHKLLPNFLIKKSDKFNITLNLLDGNLESLSKFEYKNCVLRFMSYPEIFYGKNSDKVMTVRCEFNYDDKITQFFEIKSTPITEEEKIKINKIISNENLLLDDALQGAKHYYNKKKMNSSQYNKLEKYIKEAKSSNDKMRFKDIQFEK